MQLPPLHRGYIKRRYKRFLADVALTSGELVTAHCPNTGAMTSCWAPDAAVELSYHDNPKRKLAWTLERVDMGAGWVGVHTGRTNDVITEGIEAGQIPLLNDFAELKREVAYTPPGHQRSRLDALLRNDAGADVYVEIKNTTLFDGDVVRFPDAVTARGRKHLDVLAAAVQAGYRGVILFAVNRPEGRHFEPAWDIDPQYAQRLCEVVDQGVEPVAVRIEHTDNGMQVGGLVEIELNAP